MLANYGKLDLGYGWSPEELSGELVGKLGEPEAIVEFTSYIMFPNYFILSTISTLAFF